ncbi:MAG TPA: prepilin peptidase [Candidatus Paceibacterota bacterium]|nr:prepilin peptidase [Candidatus Paceibacterota bacterium]
MISVISIAVFTLGTIVASFVGLVVARLYTGASIVRGRSQCDACSQTLDVLALIPVISFFATRGRARCCGARVSAVSTIAEIALGTLYVLAYVKIGLTLPLGLFLIVLAALLALVLYDLAHTILPPIFLGIFLCAALAFALTQVVDWKTFGIEVLIAGSIGLFIALLHFGSKGRAMGLADAPLAFGLGLLVGPHAFSGLVFSFWIGALIGITLLVRAPKGARMGIEVPFAPFLAAGFLLAYFTEWNPFTLISDLLLRLFGV